MTDWHGKFVWYDVMTTDTDAAAAFYRSVVGWTTADAGMADRPYTLLSAGGTTIGGLMPIPPHAQGARPCWTCYIAVDDVDAYAERVRAAGGAVHRSPEDIPNVGRFAVVADPAGAGFILFRGTDGQGPQHDPSAPGHVGWHELWGGDPDSAFAFYSGLFGWRRTEAMDMGPMGIYQMFATGGPPAGGMLAKPPQVPVAHWLTYFNVDAIDAATARVTQGGGKVTNGPHQVPTGQWIIQCLDPQGAAFALLAPQR